MSYDQRTLEIRMLELIKTAAGFDLSQEKIVAALEHVLSSERAILETKRACERAY